MTAEETSLDQLTFLSGESPVSRSRSRAVRRLNETLDISGLSSSDWSRLFGPSGSLWRTLAASSAWHSTRCGLTWKIRDTPLGRRFFQLAVSMRRTGGTASGSWQETLFPTPMPSDVDGGRTTKGKDRPDE